MDDTLHIYCRVSTKEQSENNTSLDTQRTLGVRCSEQLGINYKIWDEGAQSSSKDDLDNRPILVELLKNIEEGKVSKLYVWNTDRLSRNQKTWSFIRWKLKEGNVSLYCGSDMSPIDLTNPMDDLLVGILSEISQYDNKLRTERFRLGKLKRVKEGGWLGGPPPYGYSVEEKRLVVNEEESKWVKFIFESYADGMTVANIKMELLKNGVKTRRGKDVWSLGSINALLGNSHYEGFYKMTDKRSGETIRVDCDAIVSKSLVSKVKKVQQQRSYAKGDGKIHRMGRQKRDYLLKGLLVCGGCGKYYGGRTAENQHLSHYYCVSNERNWVNEGKGNVDRCVKSKRNLKIKVTDDLVWDTVMDVVSNSVLFREDIKNEILDKNSVNSSKSEIETEEKRLKGIDKELKEITETIVELETDKLLKKRTQTEVDGILKGVENYRLELERKRENIVSIINGTKKSLKWVDWVNEFSDRIGELKSTDDMKLKRKFLEGLLDRIIVKSDNKQTHSLRLLFKIPYVDDELVWNDEKDKKKGYTLSKGSKSKTVDFDGKNYLSKKEITE